MKNFAYIDDNKDCLNVVKSAFNELKIDIDIYDDPIQFYNCDETYKVVISDFDMPFVNGQELIALLKEKNPMIKTIIYSGVVDKIDELNLDIDTFLLKPVEFKSLLKVANYLLFEYHKANGQ